MRSFILEQRLSKKHSIDPQDQPEVKTFFPPLTFRLFPVSFFFFEIELFIPPAEPICIYFITPFKSRILKNLIVLYRWVVAMTTMTITGGLSLILIFLSFGYLRNFCVQYIIKYSSRFILLVMGFKGFFRRLNNFPITRYFIHLITIPTSIYSC